MMRDRLVSNRTSSSPSILVALTCMIILSGCQQVTATPPQDVPEGYQQILPRGGIPAIDNPKYVTADEASINDDSFVLGIVIDNQAVAYSLNLLNGHEIVNDTIGKTNFAAVW